MKHLLNEDLAKEVYEAHYKSALSFEVFMRRLVRGFDLLKENQEIKEQKKKRFLERDQLEEIKMALQYNQARLIQLLKENDS